jgi:hypothetical protein
VILPNQVLEQAFEHDRETLSAFSNTSRVSMLVRFTRTCSAMPVGSRLRRAR